MPIIALWRDFEKQDGECRILDDYEPYRVFLSAADGQISAGGGINYCKDKMQSAAANVTVAVAD
jgi:hypothetical protein